jgi:hypothetical protein
MSNFSLSNTVDLICEIKSTVVLSNVGQEKSAGKAFLHIYQDPLMKSIDVSSDVDEVDKITVLSTKETAAQYISFDQSNESKWDVQQNRSYNNGVSKTRIIIDRSTGSLLISRESNLNNKLISIKASGNCEKIDPNNRKF